MAAPDAETNEDQWLYGDDDDNTPAETSEITPAATKDVTLPSSEDAPALEPESKFPEASDEPPADNNDAEPSEKDSEPFAEGDDEPKKDGEDTETEPAAQKNTDEDGLETIEDFDDEDSDDDVNIVIGDIKTGPAAYTNFNVKRGTAPVATGDKSKFTPDEFEGVGMINGVPAHEFNIDSLEDKPWRKPGADITDYFNYGFNEATWQAYCERQKRMRTQESGTGLTPAMGPIAKVLANSGSATGSAIVNENSKYSGVGMVKKAGPPPARKLAGSIDVIGGNVPVRRDRDRDRERGDRERDRDTPSASSESAIQVMTAEKREYSRKTTLPDVSVPPPGIPPFDIPTIPTVVGTPLIVPTIAPFMDPYGSEYFAEQESTYYSGFEPTQDSQWGSQPGWPGANLSVPPPIVPGMGPPPRGRGDDDEREERLREKSSRRDDEERDKDRDRDKEDRDKDRDRDRDRESRRERDRDREKSSREDKDRRRRHRSGSRSPSSSSSHKRKRSKRSRESSERD